jgi:hypothetical protein
MCFEWGKTSIRFFEVDLPASFAVIPHQLVSFGFQEDLKREYTIPYKFSKIGSDNVKIEKKHNQQLFCTNDNKLQYLRTFGWTGAVPILF